ncbi:DUF6929 family protein [Myroides marinus]|uniref:DUF6929 family protein n=1 Tax=Myroides marinus TaxID=703342 RepID=UPI000741AF87|nr:hypothetical protein [Myroides marinus]KUF40244.1 hypothetical protein AS361_16600 [Myroides marinus]MDM1345944.1 hypothetical protein [Myroides marinus]MDM1353127.1 hypothetical protein [Myroides marinus]MDM1360697.1 hypothetical protein [Myroides marinus]MDM1368635.1 hypothetical protein [Myroides marinus]
MKQIALELLFQLLGIGAASGLVYDDNQIHLISDNSTNFYHYNIEQQHLYKTPLSLDNIGEDNIYKAAKPDYEAITTDGVNYYVFGSGSKPNRIKLVEVNKLTNEVISENELDILYASMKSFANLSDEDFNIEGVIYDNELWYFFNRGNGPKKANGIFVVKGNNILNDFQLTYTPIKLPKLNKVQTSFTDAIKVEDKIYFLAAAEDSNSTYADGEIKGTILGRINLDKLKVEKTITVSETHKFEGLTLYSQEGKNLEFLLCEDPDNDTNKSGIYKLSIKK